MCRRVSERLGAGTGKHKLIVNIGSLLAGAAEEEEEGFDLLAGEGVAAGLVVEAGEGVLEAVAAAELVGELRHGAVDVLGVGVVEEGEGALGDAVASGGTVQVWSMRRMSSAWRRWPSWGAGLSPAARMGRWSGRGQTFWRFHSLKGMPRRAARVDLGIIKNYRNKGECKKIKN